MNQHMLGSIHPLLSKLGIGFNAAQRSIALRLSDNLNDSLYLQYVSGHTAINQGLELELICLSTDATIPLSSLIGQTGVVDQLDQHGQIHSFNGIITQASSGQNDGGFALYKLTLQDSFSGLMLKRRNSRVFMQKSVLDITRILFSEWQQHSALFGKSLKLDLSQITKNYGLLPFSMQSQETDYHFLTRLWRRAGINWIIDSNATAEQQLVLFDHSQTRPQNIEGILYFHHADHKTEQDSIHTLVASRQLQSTHVHVQRWSQQYGDIEQQASIIANQQSDKHSSASLNLEQAWYTGDAALGDLDDASTQPTSQQLTRLGEILIQRHAFDAKSYQATGSVRAIKVGHWFSLGDHPIINQQPANEHEFLITELSFYAQNNLPKEIDSQISQLLQKSQWVIDRLFNNSDQHQNNNNSPNQNQSHQQPAHQVHMTLVQRDTPIVPFYHPAQHVARAQPMRARVVANSGETIHVDAWGRIKVRFLFTRPDDHQHSGGAGSSDTDSDSAWVDLLTAWAGDGSGADDNYGTRFLPRAGELVVIDFLDGNADQPYVVGRIHEGSRLPAQFDGTGTLPDTQALSGIKSQEIDGDGFNQLRLDDTTGQISAQLQSSHAASQLNLGNLSHPKATGISQGRGHGFELRTDQFGAVRAGKGLLLSTHAQNQASGNHLNAAPAKSQLESSYGNGKTLSDIAKAQHSEPLDVLEHLQSLISQLEQTDPAQADTFKAAILLLASPASIALSSQADINLSADAHISHSAGDSISLSTQQNLIAQASQSINLFAMQQGISVVAAKGKLSLQAQGDGIEAIARKVIEIISTEDRIEITSPKEIKLDAGGSQVLLNGQGVFSKTGAKFECKAAQHVFMGGQAANVETVALKKLDCQLKASEASASGSPMIEMD